MADEDGGSIYTRKVGPLPVWGWMGIALAAALAVASWRRSKAAPAADATSTSSADYQLPSTVQPTYAFVDADSTVITVPSAPPGGGRPPTQPPGSGGTGIGGGPFPLPRPVPRPPLTKPYPNPPRPVPSPRAPAGGYVTVAKWNARQAPWNSTLWGIAAKELGSGKAWTAIWNDPRNASLRRKRGSADRIQPGDKVWVSK